jgi:hypothetical protein
MNFILNSCFSERKFCGAKIEYSVRLELCCKQVQSFSKNIFHYVNEKFLFLSMKWKENNSLKSWKQDFSC